jgi:hypothetical protein
MSLTLGKVFKPFVEERPICVMARDVLLLRHRISEHI